MSTRIVLVPGTLALLPEHASLIDPVPELRAACLAAVAWLGTPDEVLADDQGRRVADALVAAAGVTERATGADRAVLVVGNGSATRSEKAPGHLDERALAFDVALGAALRRCDVGGVDLSLADELWARLGGIPALADLLDPDAEVSVDHDAAPYGVQWWVMRWTCGS